MFYLWLLCWCCCLAARAHSSTANEIDSIKTEERGARDTYIDAYKDSHQNENLGGFQPSSPPGGYAEPPSAERKTPSAKYGPPTHIYGPPAPIYGPPAPAPIYGPPAPVYGPPAPIYGYPFSSPSSFLPTLSLGTVLKIILKLVLFKMLIKFIAVICLLLFIPKFDLSGVMSTGGNNGGNNGGNHDNNERSLANSFDHYLSILENAIEKYTKLNDTNINTDKDNIKGES